MLPVLFLLWSPAGEIASLAARGEGGDALTEYSDQDEDVAAVQHEEAEEPPRRKVEHALFDENMPIVEIDASRPPLKFSMQHCPRVNPKKPAIFQGVHGTVSGAMNAGFEYSNSTVRAQLVVACYRKYMPSLGKANHGSQLVANIIGVVKSYCLGATKLEQLACRRDLAKLDGCDYKDVHLQPVQFNLPQDCEKLDTMPIDKPFLIKPISSNNGRGIRYLPSRPNQAECRREYAKGFIAQLYVNSPLLQGRKFDVRTFLLVGRLDPLLLFQAPGYVSVSSTVYDPTSTDPLVHITNVKGQEEDPTHYRTFESVQQELHSAYQFPKDYMLNSFLKQTARGAIYVAMSQFKTAYGDYDRKPRTGYFHLFACDWIIDRLGKVHLLECNGFPWQGNLALKKKPNASDMWHEMMALVLDVNIDPGHLFGQSAWGENELVRKGVWKDGVETRGTSLTKGFTFGHWSLIYSQLETPMDQFNACDMPEVEVVD